MARRVVITGLGVVTGLGLGSEPLWQGLLDGKSAIRRIEQIDATSFPIGFASEVDPGLKVRKIVPKSYRKAVKVMCRDIELAVAAAALAVEDAGLTTKGTGDGGEVTFDPGRVGCQIGAGLIVAEINELTSAFSTARDEPDGSFSMLKWGGEGMEELTPLWLLKFLPNMLACHVTIIHECCGPSNTITCNEVSGALSIGESRRVIERGDADLCFSGGAESKINQLGLLRQWYTNMFADTRECNDEECANLVRPFSESATGSVPGEGAAILTIEAMESAEARGSKIYAEIVGFGASQSVDLDLKTLEPSCEGTALSRAIERALSDAVLKPSQIDAIVPMGLGAKAYDAFEQHALETVFGDGLSSIPFVLTKPHVGTCAAASTAIDVAVAALCLSDQKLPARLNGVGIPADLDVGVAEKRDADLRYVLVCGIGFGGQNTAVILERY